MARPLPQEPASYPGLAELFRKPDSARQRDSVALSPESLLKLAVRICERVAKALKAGENGFGGGRTETSRKPRRPGDRWNGILRKEIVRALLSRGRPVRVVARREPSPWERIFAGAEYVVADVATERVLISLKVDTVIHAAAKPPGLA